MNEPRPRRPGGRPYSGTYAPKLSRVEQALIVLALHPGEWQLIDEWPEDRRAHNSTSALSTALRRRGVEIAVRGDDGVWRCFARWSHELPNGVER